MKQKGERREERRSRRKVEGGEEEEEEEQILHDWSTPFETAQNFQFFT